MAETVFESFEESMLSLNMTMGFGNVNIKRRNKLQKTVNVASDIIGKVPRHLSNMYEKLTRREAERILNAPSHPQ